MIVFYALFFMIQFRGENEHLMQTSNEQMNGFCTMPN